MNTMLIHQFDEVFGVKVPLPALERGWLHSRQLCQPWDIQRIAEQIGDRCWFSHHNRDRDDAGPDDVKLRPTVIAGFWPRGGFVQLFLQYSNSLEVHPGGTLSVFAESPKQADALMADLVANFRHDASAHDAEPRLGILNFAYGSLSVERIKVSADQTIPRDQVDLYYGDGALAWVDEWVRMLRARRYGLTVLTGPPGTGKTSLLRSLARWLSATHVFYFMPAARFADVASGEIVSFWVEENRNSKLRKVLILEDAESVLLRRDGDNREKVATLLNLTDGMLGDALGLHVVCTMNSDLLELDPALLRPGRLVAHRDFDLLTSDEARRLAAALGLPEPESGPVALAEIFNSACAPVAGAPSPRRRVMGFHAAAKPIGFGAGVRTGEPPLPR